jgi:hypothetical protein
MPIDKRHSLVFVVGVRLDLNDASVSVPRFGRTVLRVRSLAAQ